MKVVKLDNRYSMSRYGFTHAFRFEYESRNWKKIDAIERMLYDIYQYRPPGYGPESVKFAGPWCYRYHRFKPYFIGVRDESMISLIILSINNN